jgi:enoyl-CoA hydratase/carnithine racemase
MSHELDVRSAGRTWTFTLNRPDKLNAMNGTLVDALLQAVEEANAQGARLLVFRGAGKSFSAGFDLSDLEAQSEGDLVLRFVRIEMLLQAVAGSAAQTVGLAHGKVFGAGVDLFAACRHRIAAPDAVFRMPGLKFGLVLGTRRFGRIVGHEAARRVLEEVGSFDAQRASDMGFVNRVAAVDLWDGIVAEAEAKADVLDDVTRAALFSVLAGDEPDADLAYLVRSAARFGLKDRLRRYLGK